MFIKVNSARLFVDIEGPSLVPDGPDMREKPTLILLHGGPGADHSLYKPAFSQLSDLCQIVYYDHLGNGRSDEGAPDQWTLDRWGDDIKALSDALGITKPIIYGASFGGVVAQSYATRHPEHPAALILASTTAKTDFEIIYEAFRTVGGPKAHEIAKRYWSDPTPERRQAYFETCLPLYSRVGLSADAMSRMIIKNPVGMHYNGPANEQGQFDFRSKLSQIECPTLVLAGDSDPIMPSTFSETLSKTLPNARYHLIEGASHMLDLDAPEVFFSHLRAFILEISS